VTTTEVIDETHASLGPAAQSPRPREESWIDGQDGDRRATPRSRALIAATAIYEHGQYTSPCMVRNMSPHGVLLRIDAEVALTADFHLQYDGHPQKHRVELRWRRGNAAGVAFVTAKAAEAADTVFDLAVQIEALRLENAALRQQQAKITRRLADLGYVAKNEF
jgi:hypothetical protein